MIIGSDLEWAKVGDGYKIDVLGLAWDEGKRATACDRNERTLAEYLDILRKAEYVVGQNFIDADCRQLASEGIDVSWLEPKVKDTRLMMHAVNGHLAGTGSYDLRSIVLLLNGRQGHRFPLDFKQYETDLHRTCGMDAAAAAWAYPTLDRLVKTYKLERTVETLHKASPIFALMRTQGVRLDTGVLEKIYRAKKEQTERTIEKYHLWEERGKKVIKRVPIWRSDKLLDICEQNFGFRPADRKRATWVKLQNADYLTPEAREFVNAIIDLGKGANDAHWLGKAEEGETEEDGISFGKVREDGFIFPRYDICGSPDRAIASGPNIQNFPRPSDDPRGIKLRSAVVPLDDSHIMLGVDFSSVETITNAIESQDWDRARDALEKKISHEGTADLINRTFGLSLNRNQGKAINHGFDKGECVTPDTKILKSDLTWAAAGDLKMGDELIGFDEDFHTKKSRYQRSKVEKVSRIVNPCYLIETDKGSMVASAKHAWLVRNFENVYKWRTTDKLKVGKQLKFFGSPWDFDAGRNAGWLAGLFDGEGSISNNGKTSAEVTVSQNQGPILDLCRELLTTLDYPIRERSKTHKNSNKICGQIAIRSRYEAMRFLGSVRPTRLLLKASKLWENASVSGGHHEHAATITKVTFIGNLETIALKTSTKTIITNGFLTHNSPYNLARTLFKTERPSRHAVQQCHQIFGAMLNKYPNSARFRNELWERSRENPLVVQNSFGRRLLCFSRAKYGESNERFAKHDPTKKYWCSCSECGPRRDRWKYAIAFLGRSAAFDALLQKMQVIWYEKRLDEFSLPYLEVHDELDFSVPKEKVEHYARIAKAAFEEPIPELGGVSLPASVIWGSNWSEAH